jgi:hypothetical protein
MEPEPSGLLFVSCLHTKFHIYSHVCVRVPCLDDNRLHLIPGNSSAGTKLTNPILAEMEKSRNPKTLGMTRFLHPLYYYRGRALGFLHQLSPFPEKVNSSVGDQMLGQLAECGEDAGARAVVQNARSTQELGQLCRMRAGRGRSC